MENSCEEIVITENDELVYLRRFNSNSLISIIRDGAKLPHNWYSYYICAPLDFDLNLKELKYSSMLTRWK